MSFRFAPVSLKLTKEKFEVALKEKSPPRFRDGQTPDPKGPVRQVPYDSDEFRNSVGEYPVMVTPDGTAYILPPGGVPTEHPETQNVFAQWTKQALVDRYKGLKSWATHFRGAVEGSFEADHIVLSADRAQGEDITLDHMRQAALILADVLRTPPLRFTRDLAPEVFENMNKTPGDIAAIDGHRFIYMLPIHDNTDNVHIQVFLSRYAVDTVKREVSSAIKQHEGWAPSTQTLALNGLFKSYGLPFEVVDGFKKTRTDPKTELGQDQVDDLIKTIEEEGGVAPARLTKGMEGQLSGGAAVASLNPDLQRVQQDIDLTTQELAQAEALRSRLAARLVAQQHAASAIMRDETAKTEVEIAKAEAADLQNRLAMEAEKLLRSQDDVSRLEGILEGEKTRQDEAIKLALAPVEQELKQVREHAAKEPERIAEAVKREVEPLKTQLDEANKQIGALRGDLEKSETKYVESETRWSALLKAANEGWEATKRELASVKASLKTANDRIAGFAKEIDDAVLRAEGKLRMNMTDAFESASRLVARAHAEAIAAKDATISGLRDDVADLKAQVSTLTAKLAVPVAAVGAGLTRVAQAMAGKPAEAAPTSTASLADPGKPASAPGEDAKGKDFASVPQADWSADQQRVAVREFERAKKNPKFADLTMEKWAETLHAAWLKKNAPRGPNRR